MSKIKSEAASGLYAVQYFAARYIHPTGSWRSRKPKLWSNPSVPSDICAKAKPLARLIFDPDSKVALDVLVVSKCREPSGGGKSTSPLFRILAQHIDGGAKADRDERSKPMITRREMQHSIEGRLDRVDRERRLQ